MQITVNTHKLLPNQLNLYGVYGRRNNGMEGKDLNYIYRHTEETMDTYLMEEKDGIRFGVHPSPSPHYLYLHRLTR